jgi:hypothetical protein
MPYPPDTASIIQYFWPDLARDISGDWEIASSENGLELVWLTDSMPKPTPADIEALRNSAEWLGELKQQKANDLYSRRVKAEKSPFQHQGRWYDGSDDSIARFGVVSQQITWALMAGTPTDTVVITGGWRDLTDVGGPSTIAEIQSFLQSHYQHGVLCEQNSQAKKAEIAAAMQAEDPISALDQIDLDAGWPEPAT